MKSFDTLITAQARTAIKENNHIKQVISQIVPATSVAHIEFFRVEGGRLRVTVDNAAWIAKLRFVERQLVRALRAENFDVHTVSWHVSPAEKPVPRVTRRAANPLTKKSAEALTALAAADQSATEKGSREPMSESGEKLRLELLKLAAKLKQ